MSLGLGLFRIGRISIEWCGYTLIRKNLKRSDLGIVRRQKKMMWFISCLGSPHGQAAEIVRFFRNKL